MDRGQILKVFIDIINQGLFHVDLGSDHSHFHRAKINLSFKTEEFVHFIKTTDHPIPESLKEWAIFNYSAN
jgi:hypothetical protein